MIQINETISYIPSTREPLSAEIGVICGRERLWFYDVGDSRAAREEILALLPSASFGGVVLSHFHPDHIGNLFCFPDEMELYVGENTRKYTKKGVSVAGDLYLEDGCELHLFPLPSTHARGSLGLEVNGEYAFLGDGLYPGRKGGRAVYNAQFLREQIRVLKALKAHTFLISHQAPFSRGKEETICRLEEIYSRREKNLPYIGA